MPEFLLQPQTYLAVGAFLCFSVAFGILKRLVKFAITCTMLLAFGLMSFLMISEDPAEDMKRIREGFQKGKEKVEEVKEVVEDVRDAAEKADETVEKIKNAVEDLPIEDVLDAIAVEK
ncbi:MAG: hypothetical protein ACRBF0_08865 [Calditrichia bacterium]